METSHISDRKLFLYILDELSPGDKKAVQEHLQKCHQCQCLKDKESKFFQVLKSQPLLEPSEQTLESSRIRLKYSLRETIFTKERKSFFRNILDRIPTHIETKQLVMATAVFLLGLAIGRFIFPHDKRTALSSREIVFAIPSTCTMSNFQIIPVKEKSDQVEIHFSTFQNQVLRGSQKDSDIQYALSYALINNPNDNIRLRAINLLKDDFKNETIQRALIHALERDKNPGVRLKAIKLLKNFPMNEQIKEILIRILFNDTNSGVRIEAADALSRVSDENILTILREIAKDDEYVRFLVLKINAEDIVSFDR